MLRMSSASTSLGATPLCMQHENSKKYTKILNVKSSGPVAIYTTAKKKWYGHLNHNDHAVY